ncbi:hypothetical protein [Suttonella ornithocola]|uniref:Uncharacterized protein n=1 Tax=Suttonella ornithocola TaxID=279832 RepID=A0A380MZC3_9GAMM|nr:hypothetical protein [Suttonella ornithocola]SUO96817.1 Uncharacterised protein [Suttonella ornithocola]
MTGTVIQQVSYFGADVNSYSAIYFETSGLTANSEIPFVKSYTTGVSQNSEIPFVKSYTLGVSEKTHPISIFSSILNSINQENHV